MENINELTFLAALSATLPDSGEECVPGSSYKVDCNTCICLEDGTPACTRIRCENLAEDVDESQARSAKFIEETKCIPGMKFDNGCGPCDCTLDGTPVCKNQYCWS